MSNYLAVATVTEALRMTLETAVKVITGAGATSTRPDQVKPSTVGVNVFLYQVVPNAALRNNDLPTRDNDGNLMQRPKAAIDLHYLLTVHGNEKVFEPQRVLGTVVRALHDAPVLTKKSITDASLLAPLIGSNLADAPERIRFTPLPLSLEELSKLWSVFFQAKYALSVAYSASVVIIEGSDAPRSALPVQQSNLVVLPSLGPVIDRLASQAAVGSPIVDVQPIHLNYTLHLYGHGFRGGIAQVRIGNTLVDPISLTDDHITVDLKFPPFLEDDLRAGLHAVQVVTQIDFGTPKEPHVGFESNAMPFLLAPRHTAAPSFGAKKVTVNLEPKVAKGQRIVLMLNENVTVNPKAFTFSTIAATDSGTQKIDVTGAAPGKYLVRVQIDGAESPLEVGADGRYTGKPFVVVT